MYLHIGENTVIPMRDIIGIFSLENGNSYENMSFLRVSEEEGFVRKINDDPPKSFIVTEAGKRPVIYLSPISTRTLKKRSRPDNYSEGEDLWITLI
ncbi:MAG: DUF370 domain-containing protein [Clostridiaceae bacterium]